MRHGCHDKRNDGCYLMIFIVIGKKYNQTSVSDADREIPTFGSSDNAGNSVNLVSGIFRLPSGWDFSVCIGSIFSSTTKYRTNCVS